MFKTKNEMKTNGKHTFSDEYNLQKRMGESFFSKQKVVVEKLFWIN